MKKNKTYLRYLFSIFLFFMSGIVSTFILQYFHYGMDVQSVIIFSETHKSLFFLSILIILVVQLPIYIIFWNTKVGFFVTNILFLITGFANYQKMLYRPEPIYPSDILMLRDVKFLFFSIEPSDRKILLLFICAFIVILIISINRGIRFNDKWNEISKIKVMYRVVFFMISLALIIPIKNFSQNDNFIKKVFEEYGQANWIGFNQIKNYNENGIVAGFLYNLSGQVINEPEKYSKNTMKEIAEKYSNIAFEKNKSRNGSIEDLNIVFIMNESFGDPLKFDGITISPDPLANFRNISAENSSGQMLSQGYGGGTANIEFEALTGISMEPMLPSISTVYTQLSSSMNDVPSIVQYFNKVEGNDRKTTAIHPFQSSMYKRPDVYQAMGFDKIIFEEDMDFTEKLESSLYISDEASYNQLFKELSNTDEKDFIHLVTMQGHGPYYVGYFGNIQGFKIEGSVSQMDMLNYVSSLDYSDKALKYYIDFMDSFDEKTITVFWGDHQPSALGSELTALNDEIKKYLTPVVIHSNFKTTRNDLGIMSPIFYMNEILDITNSKLTSYYALLNEIRQHLPAFEKQFHIFNDVGDIGLSRGYNFDRAVEELMSDYEMILYDIFDGKNYLRKIGFFDEIPNLKN